MRACASVCVRAARITRRDFSAYQTVVSNFPPVRRFPACARPGRRKKLPVTSAIGGNGVGGRGQAGIKKRRLWRARESRAADFAGERATSES